MEKLTLTDKQIEEYRKNPDIVNWDRLCSDSCYINTHIELSEDFIREFKDYVNWYWISCKQTLSEDFIREFQDKVDWKKYH